MGQESPPKPLQDEQADGSSAVCLSPAYSLPKYAELHCLSNFTFLRGASAPEDLVKQAAQQGYCALAITDECSVAGVVRAHVAAKQLVDGGGPSLRLIIGSEFVLSESTATDSDANFAAGVNGCHFVLLARDRASYGQLSHLISTARCQAAKGSYFLDRATLEKHVPERCFALWIPRDWNASEQAETELPWLKGLFPNLWIAAELLLHGDDKRKLGYLQRLARRFALPLCAAGGVYMHRPQCRILQDTLTAIRLLKPIHQLGYDAEPNAERHLRSVTRLQKLYPPQLLQETIKIAEQCCFSLDELRYEYPDELVPTGVTAENWLRTLTQEGKKKRWPSGVPDKVNQVIEYELALIKELQYEHYFLTVYDLVAYARRQNILCQGRGSAANSVVCYCLGITEVNPDQTQLLFERFVSKERNEPPDIDVDFENARREEVIQYIYNKYGRHRAAIAATVITYRSRSAIRDVGKALAMEPELVDHLAKSVFWWGTDLEQQLSDAQVDFNEPKVKKLLFLAKALTGFPRHLSQHVGGFVISKGPLSELVPTENAAMENRSVIQWDKDDLESLKLLKVDVLALGMLTALQKCLRLVNSYITKPITLQSIPKEDPRVYDMICKADTVGVFQIESRAQMSMLPRLKPRNYYDLVIQIAIVRPGPIQGDMVHPYLSRRNNKEAVSFESKEIESVLKRTLGVPIFQEQVMKIAMVAAGFSAGEADQLRRAMAAWKKKGGLEPFREKLISGMLERGYSHTFAEKIYKQITGFGEYGFPESHSASFALLAYISSWFKCYYPAAFCCALLNSQPMGFYPPAQLLQDARRHGVTMLPVDINDSEIDCSLSFERAEYRRFPALRLGFNQVKGLSEKAREKVFEERLNGRFDSIQDLVRRTKINRREVESLAAANAFKEISGNRHQALWEALGTNFGSHSLRQLDFHDAPATAKAMDTEFGVNVLLSVPNETQNVLADYQANGFTLRRHPLALMRSHLERYQVSTAKELLSLQTESLAKTAGIVTSRQRPQTASGVTFLTLEDETGFSNVVVWPKLGERQRTVLRQAVLMGVVGKVQTSEGVTHFIASELVDLEPVFGGINVKSRNFC